MIRYLYKAKDEKGQLVTGTVRANNEIEADKILSAHNLISLEFVPQRQGELTVNLKIRVKPAEKAIFARQLSTMVSAGLPLPRAIKIVSSQTKNEALKNLYLEIYKDLEEGYSFSSALAKFPNVFDRVFTSVVMAGETTGKMDVVLAQLADQLESDNNFTSKIRGALYYPAFILVALIGISVYMLLVVIPQLKGVFENAGAQLPAATRALIWMADNFKSYWWVISLILGGAIVFFKFWATSKTGGEALDNFKLNVPLFKKLFEGMYMYRFTKVMSMLVGAGVPLLDALKVGGSVMDNVVYETSINEAISHVEKGVPLSSQLAKDPNFPDIVSQMASVGEETGQLDKVFEKVSEFYGESTDQIIKNISSLVEPAVLVMIGLGVAFLVFAVLVPIYNVSQMQ